MCLSISLPEIGKILCWRGARVAWCHGTILTMSTFNALHSALEKASSALSFLLQVLMYVEGAVNGCLPTTGYDHFIDMPQCSSFSSPKAGGALLTTTLHVKLVSP